MLFVIAVVFPPLAVLLAGKPGQAFLNVFLTIFGYFPGLMHAVYVAHRYYVDKRESQTLLLDASKLGLAPVLLRAPTGGPIQCLACGGLAGRTALVCPHCNAEFVDQPDPTKDCPRCAETIKAAARICRFCQYEFPAPSQGVTRIP